jgi:uncharacterized integral membrane protein
MRINKKHIELKELNWFGRAFVLSVLFVGGFIAGSLIMSMFILAYRGWIG